MRSLVLLLSSSALEGKNIGLFEDEFANLVGAKHAIAVSSGKMALYLSLYSLGAKKGDKIIVSDFNVPEVPALLIFLGLRPVFVDIDPRNFNINIDLIKKNIDEKTKFLLVTHMFGAPVDMDRIFDIAKNYNLEIIEDACQAVGAEYKGEKVGRFGKLGYFSFGTFKVFSTLNGGMIVTDDDDAAQFIRDLVKTYPALKCYQLLKEISKSVILISFTNRHVFNFFTYPLLSFMNKFSRQARFDLFKGEEISCINREKLELIKKKFSNLQAMLGLGNLKILKYNLSTISKKAELLDRLLKEADIDYQICNKNSQSSYFKYVVRVKNRDKVLKHLFGCGIDATYGYMTSCSTVKNFEQYSAYCPESQRLMREHIYLPIHSLLSYRDILFLVDGLKQAVES